MDDDWWKQAGMSHTRIAKFRPDGFQQLPLLSYIFVLRSIYVNFSLVSLKSGPLSHSRFEQEKVNYSKLVNWR